MTFSEPPQGLQSGTAFAKAGTAGTDWGKRLWGLQGFSEHYSEQ